MKQSICAIGKTDFRENMLQDLKDKFRRNETRKYYESIRNIKHGFQSRTNMFQDKLGNLVAGNSEVRNGWKEYFEENLNSNVIINLEASGNIYYGP
jgi:hypothetical protein